MTFLTLLQSTGGTPVVTGVGSLLGSGSLTGTGTVIPHSSGVTVPKRRQARAQPVAQGRRHPGTLPNWETHVQEALAAVEALPDDWQDLMRSVLEPLVKGAQEQATFNRMTRAQYDSLPKHHGETHMGGSDNIISLDDPAAETPFSTGDPGDPRLGASAGNHVHDMSAFLELLDSADSELRNGYRVLMTYNPVLADLLQAILWKMQELISVLGPNARDN